MSIILPEFLDASGYLVHARVRRATGGGITRFTQPHLEETLWAFGEDAVLALVRSGLAADQVRAIGLRDAELIHSTDPESKTGNGYRFDKALALAAVEVIEGEQRPLARKRRRPSEHH